MATEKSTKERRAAKEIAKLLYASLEDLPKGERRRKLNEIHEIADTIGRATEKSSKRAATRATRPLSAPSAKSRRTRVRSRAV